jgi:hypothetical protein
MGRINTVYWCDLPAELTDVEGERRFAIWPSPVEHDCCFEKAGFTEFSDSDDQWDTEWKGVLFRLLRFMAQFGAHTLLNANDVESPVRNWWGRLLSFQSPKIVLAPLERLLLSTVDDQFADAVITFGDPPLIVVRTGAGHPVVWLTIAPPTSLSVSSLVRQIAEDRPVARLELDWKYLIGPNLHALDPVLKDWPIIAGRKDP